MDFLRLNQFPLWKAHLALLSVNILYGANHVLAKGVMPHFLTPTVFILLRVAGATFLFWLIFRLFLYEKVSRKDLGALALCGIFGVAINQLCFFHGLHLSSSFNSGVIMSMNPIMVVILSFFLVKERLTITKITGILMGATGAILLSWKSAHTSNASWTGDLLLLINSLSYAIYLVIAKPLMTKYKPFTVITYVFTFGLLFVLLFPPTLPQLWDTSFSTFPVEIWLKILYVVVGVTFFTYLLTMYGLSALSATISSSYIYTQPILVVFFTFLFAFWGWSDDYRSTITTEKILYMFIIFLGVYMTSRKKTEDKRKKIETSKID
jgi:drug/metabolite transporter (DMT)-like permease